MPLKIHKHERIYIPDIILVTFSWTRARPFSAMPLFNSQKQGAASYAVKITLNNFPNQTWG
jgi:hypothetical protein